MDDYKVEDGRIVSPGKFEQCPEWAPYFWDEALQGFADEDDGQLFRFDVEPADVQRFPSLAGIARVYLRESDDGFIYTSTEER